MSRRVASTALRKRLLCGEMLDSFYADPSPPTGATRAVRHARACYFLHMTRKQVAARLGRSLATVRRLEGTELHPVVDASGVHRFSSREVEALAQDMVKPRGVRSFALPDACSQEQEGDGGCIGCSRLHDKVRRLEADRDDIEREHARQLDDLGASYRQYPSGDARY